jgi:hypothetical protein
MTSARLMIDPRHQQHDDSGVAPGISHLSLGTNAPLPSDGETHLGLGSVIDRGEGHDRDLGAGRRAKALDQALHLRHRGLIQHPGDIGHVSGRLRGKEPIDLGILGAYESGAQLKRREEDGSFGSCPAQSLSW